MRARQPDVAAYATRDGVRIGYEVFGAGEPAVVFTPPPVIVHSHMWKAQVPYLARRHRVVTIDPRGNGRSDRPADPAAYAHPEFAADTLAVMDAAGVGRAVLVGICTGGWTAFAVAADRPERVLGVVSMATWAYDLTPPLPHRVEYPFDEPLDTDEGWAKDNRYHWRHGWRDFAEFFFAQLVPEPHSSKVREDAVGWALEAGAEAVTRFREAPGPDLGRDEVEDVLRRVRCPVLTVHGTEDRCQPYDTSTRAAELTGGRNVVLDGAGHLPMAREPVTVNLLLRGFLDEIAPPERPARTRWTRPLNRPRRALYLSSPIGLGHARRDVAIAGELRALRPDLEIDWLAQSPVTDALAARGERVHPASASLASESAHVVAEAGEHDLHAFSAVRRMDEILVANFMVFHEVAEQGGYDLWIGDEAWEVDHFLHEDPDLKRAAYVWLTDFVGWLPMPEGGAAEVALTADHNAEMLDQLARFPRVRDRALFVGNPDDVVPASFGAGLPDIRAWTAEHYDFTGYVTGYPPADVADRDALRAELGYEPGEPVCVVAVGGSGVGGDLLRRVLDAYPDAARRVPGLRLVVVTGPRIHPAALPSTRGVDVLGYVPDLHRHLAASDLAVVQGGLTTTMELVAAGRPFLYVPLRNHFEQQFHVRHRLAGYGAGRCLDYADLTPDVLAAAIADEIGRPVTYKPVETDGAARAAARIAELL